MCDDAVWREPYTLLFVPDHLKMKKMCEMVVEKKYMGTEIDPRSS